MNAPAALAGNPWVVVTGISGSGRTTTLRVLEDLDYFCVDNLPASLLPSLHEAMEKSGDPRPVAVGIDVRAGEFLGEVESGLAALRGRGIDVRLLFLDCSNDVLVRRFAETRRRHPVLSDGTIVEAIRRERTQMAPMRNRTTLVIDTSELNIHQLKARVQALFGDSGGAEMVVSVMSFGFKHGLPRNPDYVFDARCLANPHFVPEMRPKTGLDDDVREYVLDTAGGADLLGHMLQLLNHSLPLHRGEGRALVTIAIGCTGGQHRSVALAQTMANRLQDLAGTHVTISHRDLPRMSSS